MRHNVLLFLFGVTLLGACSEAETDLEEEVTEIATVLTVDQRWNAIVAIEDSLLDAGEQATAVQTQRLLLQSAAFANDFRKDERAPEALQMTVRSAQGLKEWRISIEYLNRIIREYPGYKYLEDCYYQKAFLLDYHLERPEEAKVAYAEFVEKFPKSPHVPKVQERMGMLVHSVSDTALIRMFEEKNKAMADSAGQIIYGT